MDNRTTNKTVTFLVIPDEIINTPAYDSLAEEERDWNEETMRDHGAVDMSVTAEMVEKAIHDILPAWTRESLEKNWPIKDAEPLVNEILDNLENEKEQIYEDAGNLPYGVLTDTMLRDDVERVTKDTFDEHPFVLYDNDYGFIFAKPLGYEAPLTPEQFETVEKSMKDYLGRRLDDMGIKQSPFEEVHKYLLVGMGSCDVGDELLQTAKTSAVAQKSGSSIRIVRTGNNPYLDVVDTMQKDNHAYLIPDAWAKFALKRHELKPILQEALKKPEIKQFFQSAGRSAVPLSR